MNAGTLQPMRIVFTSGSARTLGRPVSFTARPRAAGSVACVLVSVMLGTAVGPSARVAWGADAAASAERLRSAANEYDAGRRAYVAKDFEAAATHFENAFHDAPRAEALRNAIRARRAARQFSRAATLAALAQERYPDDPATQSLAREALDEAAPRLYELEVGCTPECELAVDGRVVSLENAPRVRVFVDPGRHVLTASFPGSGSAEVVASGAAGARDAITLVAPPRPADDSPPVVAAQSAGETPTRDAGARRVKPLPAVVVYVGAGVTTVLAGLTVASAIDAKNNPGADRVREECRGQGEQCALYQDGRDRQFRTNVLAGATGVVAVGTLVTALFFTDWSKPKREGRAGVRRGGLFGAPSVAATPHGGFFGVVGTF